MFQFDMIRCIVLLLGQLTLSTTQDFPEIMTIVIKNNHQTITLNWKRTERFVANENLPIWLAHQNEELELADNLMEDIGPFAMYHDVEQSSAVILFHEQQRIYGLVDTRFFICALPLSQVGINIHHTVGGHYIKKREDDDFHDEFYDFFIKTEDGIPHVNSFSIDEQSSEPLTLESPSLSNSNDHITYSIDNPQNVLPNERQVSRTPSQDGDTLYAEVLVFISHNVVRHFTSDDSDLTTLVAYYLIHFNAIDMLYAKLANDVQIYINIGGLVLEMHPKLFPYVFEPNTHRTSRVLDGKNTLTQFPEYIKKYSNIFVRDSFDFFFISTHYQINCEGQPNFGISMTFDNYGNRKNDDAEYEACGVLIELRTIHSDFVTSAHELAHQMHVEHDPKTAGINCGDAQCFAIMHETGSFCRNCIKWSDQSVNELKKFASSNLDHCFLLNQPRSLRPFGVPLITIGPNQQCTCYGYQSHWKTLGHPDQVEPHKCNTKLECAYDEQLTDFDTPKPIDGTPCGVNEVCWRERCEFLESTPILQLLNNA